MLQERLSVLTRIMEENLGGIRVVRAFVPCLRDVQVRSGVEERAELRSTRRHPRHQHQRHDIFLFAAMGLVLWVGGGKVISGEITVGTLASFLTFMTIL